MWPIRKLALRGRISLLALTILVVGLGLFSWLGVQAVNKSVETTLNERLALARTLASHLDQTLTYVLVQLENIAAASSQLPTVEQFNAAAHSVRLIFTKSHIQASDIFLIGKDGRVLYVAPDEPDTIGLDMSVYPEVRDTLMTGLPSVSGLVSGLFADMPTVLIITPFKDNEDKVIGVLACSIDIEQAGIGAFIPEIRVGRTGYTEIVDQNGIVLSRTRPGSPPRLFERSDHPDRFAELISQGQATVGTCHRCHEAGGEVERRRDMLAFAPLSTASWAVAIRQSEEEALAPTRQMERGFLILGMILLVCTLLLIWAMMQGIVNPIRMLTLAAKKVAVNDFAAAVPLQRGDEIGELSAAFDNMRQEIARSRDEMMHHYKAAKHKEELRGQLLSSVIGAQEEERKRIARELHDEYGQTLTGLIMSIESLEDMLTPAQSQFREKLANAKSVLGHTLADMRKLTLDLRPASLDDLGLLAAIRTHIQTFLSETEIEVKFRHNGINQRLNPAVETAIFRIIQEAIHNVIKHANASRIDVDLTAKDGKIIASIEDNGQGFDVEAIYDSKIGTRSLGILGIQERTAILNGDFSISSHPGQGTRLEVAIPIGILSPPDQELEQGDQPAGRPKKTGQ